MGIYWAKLLPTIFYFTGIIIFFVSLTKPEYGLLFLIPILPLQTVLNAMQAYPMGKDFVDIMLFALLIGWMVKSISRGRLLESNALNLPLILLILYTFFSFYRGFSFLGEPFSINVSDPRLQTWKNYMILPFIFFLVFNNIKSKKHIRWLVLIMIGIIFLMSIRFFREYRFVDKSSFQEGMRWSGTFAYLGPNEYAAFFSHYIFIIIGIFFFTTSKLQRNFFLLTILFSVYCILFLFSRGSYLASYVGLGILALMRKNIPLMIILIIVFISFQTLLPRAVVERIQMTKNEYGELESSAQRRVNVWKGTINVISSNPVTGIGFNTFPSLGFELGDTHNIYLKLLVEQGVIGLFIFLIITFIALRSGWRLYRTSKEGFFKGFGLGFAICTISLLISNFFGDRWTYVPLGAYYWAFMALVVRANIITQQEMLNKNMNSKKRLLS